MMEEERKENQQEELNSLTLEGNGQETSQNESAVPVSVKENASNSNEYLKLLLCCQPSHVGSPQAAVPQSVPAQSFSHLLPKALSAVLHPKLPSGPDLDPQHSRDPAKHTRPNLEQLQTELRDLRDQFDQIKSQHKYGFVNVFSVKHVCTT